MSSEMLYSEIFEAFVKAPDKAAKIDVLRRNYDDRFLNFLECAFNPGIIFDVEIPEYRPAIEPAGLNFTYLDLEMGKMYRFVVGHPNRPTELTSEKQQKLLLVVLESLHKDEAALLVNLLKKDLGIPSLTKKLVSEAFPNLDLG